jgi:cell division protein FtsL
MTTHQSFITRPEIQFWLPILVYTITLSCAFMSLKSDIRNLTTIMEATNNKIVVQETRISNLMASVNKFANCVIRLESIHNLECSK